MILNEPNNVGDHYSGNLADHTRSPLRPIWKLCLTMAGL